jgi:integrase
MFYVKDAKKAVSAIEAIVSISGKKFKYATGISVNPNFWISDSHRAKYSRKYPDGKEINQKLDELSEHINDVISFYRFKQAPTPAEFRKKVKDMEMGVTGEKIQLRAYIEAYIEAKGYKYETQKKYITAINKIAEYEKKYRKIVYLQDIDIDFYNHFRTWFYSLINPKTEKPYSKNYFGSIAKVLKKVLTHANESGHHKTDAHHHSQFIVEAEPAETIYLNTDELMKIHRLEITPERVCKIYPKIRAQNLRKKIKSMEVARAKFLVGAFTGLRVSDFNRLSDTDFTGDYLKVTTRKTMKQVIVPVHPVVKFYMETDFFRQKMSEQKINDRIKEVCQLAELTQPVTFTRTHAGRPVKTTLPKHQLVTTHTARRSAATNMYKAGIPAISIMKITGHTTQQSFMKYIKISEEENAEILAGHAFFKG